MLENKIKEYFQEIDMSADISVKVQNNTCTISISKMYEGLGGLISFKALSWLSQLLSTEEINLYNEDYQSGCDSCDYGSSHDVDIVCTNCSI